MPVLLEIPENPNCPAMDAQVFQCRSVARVVTHVLHERAGGMEWCAVTGIDAGGAPRSATACVVEDSGDGACYLLTGGAWGLRLQPSGAGGVWDLNDPAQWGVPYLLLAGDASALRFG